MNRMIFSNIHLSCLDLFNIWAKKVQIVTTRLLERVVEFFE